MKVLQDALQLVVLYAEKQMSLRFNKNDYCPKEDSAHIEATKTAKVDDQRQLFLRGFLPGTCAPTITKEFIDWPDKKIRLNGSEEPLVRIGGIVVVPMKMMEARVGGE